MLARRVLLVNHQPIFRTGLRLAVEAAGGLRVVGEAASGYQAMQVAERTRPNLLLIDVDHDTYDRAISSGASGALSSRIAPEQLARALRRMAEAQPLFWEPESPPARRHQIGRSMLPAPGLTLREIEVLDCVAQGFSNRAIAEALFVNEQTVKNHMTSIFRKLDVEDRVQALILSIKRGWVDFSTPH